MRKVTVFKREIIPAGGSKLVERGWAWFHDFGLDYEELNDGVGNYTTAVVEFPDGTLENIPLPLVKFQEPYIEQGIKIEPGSTPMLFELRNQVV